MRTWGLFVFKVLGLKLMLDYDRLNPENMMWYNINILLIILASRNNKVDKA